MSLPNEVAAVVLNSAAVVSYVSVSVSLSRRRFQRHQPWQVWSVRRVLFMAGWLTFLLLFGLFFGQDSPVALWPIPIPTRGLLTWLILGAVVGVIFAPMTYMLYRPVSNPCRPADGKNSAA